MTGHMCRYCDAEIMFVSRLWLKKRVADVNGFARTALTTCITLPPRPQLKGDLCWIVHWHARLRAG